MRGFCFIIAFWGEEHRSYFTDYLIPSMLAAGNLPKIDNKAGSRFLIATTDEDWAALHENKNFLRLIDHIEPVRFPLDDDASPIGRCGKAFSIMTDLAHARGLYGVMLTPDQIWSNNVIVELQKLAQEGASLVLFPPVRQSREALFRMLGTERDFSALMLGCITLASLHPEWAAYEWDGAWQPMTAGDYWRRLSGYGMVRHSICWVPLLIDYSRMKENNTTGQAKHYLDGGYIWDNAANFSIHLVCDMNRIFIASWTPEKEAVAQLPRWLAWLGPLYHANALRRTMQLDYLVNFPANALLTPIIWGKGDYRPLPLRRHLGKKPFLLPTNVLYAYFLRHWNTVYGIGYRIGMALSGDAYSRARLAWRWRKLIGLQ